MTKVYVKIDVHTYKKIKDRLAELEELVGNIEYLVKVDEEEMKDETSN